MRPEDDEYVLIDDEDEGDLGLFPIDDVDFSLDTEWYFEGAWVALVSFLDDRYPSMTLGEAMGSEDADGHLGVWARLDFGISVLWLRVMTFSPFHWTWKNGEYN
tara:strand:- start:2685 stop:2996 length:312 start_codon:yes stop_codon:yes gene_type:complete